MAGENQYAPEHDDEPGPSRKRRREDSGSNGAAMGGQQGRPVSQQRHQPPPPARRVPPGEPIVPSIFGISPRNDFTKVIGEFIVQNCRGVENVEVEIKLGTLHAPGPEGRRIRMPTMSEMIMPPDYPVGPFASTMTKHQHASLNSVLNQAVEGSAPSPNPVRFFRAQQVDSFYSAPGGKVRVSRDRAGNVVQDGVVRKRRIADLNIYSPGQAFDWRVSCSIEDPASVPEGAPPLSSRDKDRACYRHQLCQVDLTVVTAREGQHATQGKLSYELEIEVLDVPGLLEAYDNDIDSFDERLQSVLDTARMLVRNVS